MFWEEHAICVEKEGSDEHDGAACENPLETEHTLVELVRAVAADLEEEGEVGEDVGEEDEGLRGDHGSDGRRVAGGVGGGGGSGGGWCSSRGGGGGGGGG